MAAKALTFQKVATWSTGYSPSAGAVVLILTTEDGRQHNFAMPAEAAFPLATQLRKLAVDNAKPGSGGLVLPAR